MSTPKIPPREMSEVVFQALKPTGDKAAAPKVTNNGHTYTTATNFKVPLIKLEEMNWKDRALVLLSKLPIPLKEKHTFMAFSAGEPGKKEVVGYIQVSSLRKGLETLKPQEKIGDTLHLIMKVKELEKTLVQTPISKEKTIDSQFKEILKNGDKIESEKLNKFLTLKNIDLLLKTGTDQKSKEKLSKDLEKLYDQRFLIQFRNVGKYLPNHPAVIAEQPNIEILNLVKELAAIQKLVDVNDKSPTDPRDPALIKEHAALTEKLKALFKNL